MFDASSGSTATLRAPEARRTGWYLSGRTSPTEPVLRIAINGDSFTIGRRGGLDLTVPSLRVSGRHAEILVVADHLFVRDLGSTNGTFVNRERLAGTRRIQEGDHIEIADVEFRVEYEAPGDRAGPISDRLKKTNRAVQSFESDWVFSQFEQLVRGAAVKPSFQPILKLSDLDIYGYEALARSAVDGLRQPREMFEVASLLNREAELSMICRVRALEEADSLARHRPIFVNTHPRERLQEDVLPQLRVLREQHPRAKLVLEIHEGTIQHPQQMREVLPLLKDLDIQLAYDDFGAGRARLLELVQCPPDILKFDVGLIRNLDSAPDHQRRMLRVLVEMAHDFSAHTLAEGIETAAEAEACRDLGFEYAQGFLYGRPMPVEEIIHDLFGAPR
jgi:EAL domain-containing protein (putative c-di-GMP-specific phosphodiesterase class I)